MDIIKKIINYKMMRSCETCEMEIENVIKEQNEYRQRIKKMREEIEQAAMNGEEGWFLTTITSQKENCNDA